MPIRRPAIPHLLAAIVAATLLALLVVTPTNGYTMNGGCSLTVTSNDASGAELDTASETAGATLADPLRIEWEGSVAWDGSSGAQVFTNHSWFTFVYLIPIPVFGGDDNPEGDVTGDGEAGVAENAPFRITGLYYVSATIDGDGGAHCDGNGWFLLEGDPLTTIPFWVAVAIIVLALALLLTLRPTVVGGGA